MRERLLDAFDLHGRLIADYDALTSSLVQVRDEEIASHLAGQRERRVRWPGPWLAACTTSLERDLVTFLREGEYRLPDGARCLVPQAHAQPDFVYRSRRAR